MPLWNHNQRYYFQNYDSHFIGSCGQYHPRGYNEPFAQWNRGYYWLTGGYSVAQEASRTNVYAMLDTMGSQMSAKTLAMVPQRHQMDSGVYKLPISLESQNTT